MTSYSKDQLIKAALEAAQLELEHASDLEPVLAREGIALDDFADVANRVTHLMLHNFQEKSGRLSEEDFAAHYASCFAGYARGFTTALQLMRAEPETGSGA